MKSVHPNKFFSVFKKTLILTLYLAVWFCAINFYAVAVLHAGAVPHITYLYAIFLAGILAKFMIAEQEIAPLTVKEGSSLYWLIIRRTTIDTMIALFLRYIFAGIEGVFNHHGFIEAMSSFGGGDFKHILSIWILFWLIIMPYMVYRCLSLAIGSQKIHSIFVGKNVNAD
jgi:hypothetical protein